MPVGPGICLRCLVSTPLSVSAALSMSALASEPTCVMFAGSESLRRTTALLSRTDRPMRRCTL